MTKSKDKEAYFVIMETEYLIQILVSLLIISVGLLLLLTVMICSSYYSTLPSLIQQRSEQDKEMKQLNFVDVVGLIYWRFTPI